MTSAKTEREKLLILQVKYKEIKKDLEEARLELASLNTRKDQPVSKPVAVHLIEIIKVLIAVIVAMAGYKYGVKL